MPETRQHGETRGLKGRQRDRGIKNKRGVYDVTEGVGGRKGGVLSGGEQLMTGGEKEKTPGEEIRRLRRCCRRVRDERERRPESAS